MEVLSRNNPSGNQFTDDTNRLVNLYMTFDNFPEDVPVDTYLLAHNGFFYTGIGDRVKCSDCNVAIEDWQPGDDANLSKFHKSNCKFARPTKNTRSQLSAGDVLNGLGGNSSRNVTNYPRPFVISVATSDTLDYAPPSGSRRPC